MVMSGEVGEILGWFFVMSGDVRLCRVMSSDVEGMSGDVGWCRVMSGEVGWSRGMSGDVGWCRVMSGYVGWCRGDVRWSFNGIYMGLSIQKNGCKGTMWELFQYFVRTLLYIFGHYLWKSNQTITIKCIDFGNMVLCHIQTLDIFTVPTGQPCSRNLVHPNM